MRPEYRDALSRIRRLEASRRGAQLHQESKCTARVDIGQPRALDITCDLGDEAVEFAARCAAAKSEPHAPVQPIEP